MDECGIGPLGSIRKRPWSEATSKTHDCYTHKASEIIAEVLKIHSGSPCLPEGWAGRESAKPRHRFNSKQKRYLEGKFKHVEITGVKANPDDVSKGMRCLRDENGKRIFTVEEFLCPQQIFLFFSRMACKRRDATESDDEAEGFVRKQVAVHSDVMEALQHKITHHLLFSGKNLCLINAWRHPSLLWTTFLRLFVVSDIFLPAIPVSKLVIPQIYVASYFPVLSPEKLYNPMACNMNRFWITSLSIKGEMITYKFPAQEEFKEREFLVERKSE